MSTTTTPIGNPRKFKFPKVELKAISGSALAATDARADRERNFLIDDMIAAGRGYWLQSQIAECKDADCVHYTAVAQLQVDLGNERRRRLEFNGTLKPLAVPH